MAKKLQLQVPTPCHENWDKMTPTEKGRFCASCQKQVIDFSNKSDREIAMFFKKPSSGSVCGRFMDDQLNRNIEIPKKRIPWLKYFFQIAIPAFLASCDHRTQGKIKVADTFTLPGTNKQSTNETGAMGMIMTEIIEKDSAIRTSDTIPDLSQTITETCTTTKGVIAAEIIVSDTCIEEIGGKDIDTASLQPSPDILPDSGQVNIAGDFSLNGKIIDERGKPVPFANISIKGTPTYVVSDVNGMFSITPKFSWDKIMLATSCVGFVPQENQIQRSNYHDHDTIILAPLRYQVAGDTIVVGVTPGKTKKQKSIPLLQAIFKDTSFSKFRIYPNPIRRNSTLTIEWKQKDRGDHLLQLFNQSGQLILSKDICIDEKARLLTMNMPTIIAGNYFLKLTSKTTGRSYTEKLIVE